MLGRHICIPRVPLYPRLQVLVFISPFYLSVVHITECCVWGRGESNQLESTLVITQSKNIIQGQLLRMLRWRFIIAAVWNKVVKILTFILYAHVNIGVSLYSKCWCLTYACFIRHQDCGNVYYLFASQIHAGTCWEEQRTSHKQSNFHFQNMKDF